MKILVCISNVPETTTKIRFTSDKKALDTVGVSWIINPWDELALTRALELKEGSGGKIEKVSVANVGRTVTDPTIRKALAIGADDGYRIDADPKDAYFVAAQLAELVNKEGFEIVLCGIESSDFNGSAVGGMLSEFLGYQSVSSVSGVQLAGDVLNVKREIDGGKEIITVSVPLVAIVQKGIAIDPRIPNMRGIMMARQKPLIVVPPAAIEALTEISGFDIPPAKAACKVFSEENVKDLIDALHSEAKVI